MGSPVGSIYALFESELWSFMVVVQKLLPTKASHWSRALCMRHVNDHSGRLASEFLVLLGQGWGGERKRSASATTALVHSHAESLVSSLAKGIQRILVYLPQMHEV